MKLLKSLAVTGIAFLCSQAVAVDGFQELKFGMTLDEVKKTKKCDWKKHKSIHSSYQCSNFTFFGEKTKYLTSYNSSGKLVQIQVIIPDIKLKEVMEGLPKKYKISTPYTEKIEKGNKQISVKFDDDTLELRVTHQGESEFNYTALLIYSDKNYLLSLDEKKRKG
ncbi:hypothetical protein [Mannheimia haemolytica]|uniref:hypothetical protein n=1 Tax=Mannheimia haemolytica TaxID=75985 RepID=UPI00038647C4|nr:hypothetical protein [Mannheimia haemolytica]EPZ00554.1 hypothetical protein L278_00805 [Mannheimia haemolytica D35]MDW1149434.1 hypothetical protein [Mannheimia haemolytica]MDW1159530.1 hypothetical protein [Mannheimia haemolytica]